MCVIIEMKAGKTIELEAWMTAVNNNENGFGMLVKIPPKKKGGLGEIKLIEEFSEEGLNPFELYKVLKEYDKYDRWVHLRFKTVGSISQDNVQPFKVYDKNGHVAYFMHNGTLSQFKPLSSYGTVYNADTKFPGCEDWSDTRIFAEKVLKVGIPNMYGDNGVGDYACEFYQDYLDDLWKKQGPADNRGVIISNYAPTVILNPDKWTNYYNSTGDYDEFYVSNDLYFQDLKRGAVFDLKKKQDDAFAKAERERNNANRNLPATTRNSTGRSVDTISDFRLNSTVLTAIPSLVNIFGDPDLFDGDTLNSHYLAGVTDKEWVELFKNKEFDVAAYIMSQVCEEMYDVSEELFSLRGENDEMGAEISEKTAKISRLSAQIQALNAKVRDYEGRLGITPKKAAA